MRRIARSILANTSRVAAQTWWGVRQIFGDAAYANYLRNFTTRGESVSGSASTGAPAAPLSPSDFYLDSLRRRYSRISRCC
jgi:hypothetical protein